MSVLLAYVGIFICSLVLEVGWILAVRLVTADRQWIIALNAVVMQAISNSSTLILVSDSWTSVSSVIGAGTGALIGMRIRVRPLSVDRAPASGL